MSKTSTKFVIQTIFEDYSQDTYNDGETGNSFANSYCANLSADSLTKLVDVMAAFLDVDRKNIGLNRDGSQLCVSELRNKDTSKPTQAQVDAWKNDAHSLYSMRATATVKKIVALDDADFADVNDLEKL